MQGYGIGDCPSQERGVGHQQPHLRVLNAQPHQGTRGVDSLYIRPAQQVYGIV